jgi:hypothetical protein
MQSISERDRSNAALAHDIVNKLAAIVGLCDLLLEKTDQGSEAAARLTEILDLASTAANDLKQFQRQLAARLQTVKPQQDEVA